LKIHNVFIIDASGSMFGSKYETAITGINELLQDIKKDTDTENTVTVVEFRGNEIKRVMDVVDADKLSGKYSGIGANGSTPLNQAVGETLEYIFGVRKNYYSSEDKVLVNVFTDGGENSSSGKYANYIYLGEYIKDLEKQGFTITFMGTKDEVNYATQSLNLSLSNTLVHTNTAASIKMSYGKTVRARQAFSKSVSAGQDATMNFYSKVIDSDQK
jgi:Mg-chelatase subunit ChlD